MKPIFNKLVDLAITKTCDTTLEKLLAFKKSILSFETRWELWRDSVTRLGGFYKKYFEKILQKGAKLLGYSLFADSLNSTVFYWV